MKIILRLVALLLSMIMMALCVSCEHNTNVVLSTVVEPTFTPVTITPTMTPTAVPSSTPTSTPVLTATEAAFSKERIAELDQQIQDFLNYQGEYSKENIQEFLLPEIHYPNTIIRHYNLGLVYFNESHVETQTWLFDYLEKDGDLVLIVGFDGKDGQRFVTCLNIPISVINKSTVMSERGIDLIKLDSWCDSTGEHVFKSTSDIDVIKHYLITNKPLLIGSRLITSDETISKEVGGDALAAVCRYYNNSLPYIENLVYQIHNNGTELGSAFKLLDKKITQIEKISDINILSNSTMPIVGQIVLDPANWAIYNSR